MTIELDNNERDLMLIALGMAAAVSMQLGSKDMVPPLRLLIGKLAPDSYWALQPEGECSITAGDPDKLGVVGTFR